jgi:hypothetical protein
LGRATRRTRRAGAGTLPTTETKGRREHTTTGTTGRRGPRQAPQTTEQRTGRGEADGGGNGGGGRRDSRSPQSGGEEPGGGGLQQARLQGWRAHLKKNFFSTIINSTEPLSIGICWARGRAWGRTAWNPRQLPTATQPGRWRKARQPAGVPRHRNDRKNDTVHAAPTTCSTSTGGGGATSSRPRGGSSG